MLDLLIIQHEDDTPPGTVLTWASQKKLNYKIWKINESSKIQDAPQDVKALLICGGSMDTWEEEKYPWLKVEKQYLQDFLRLKRPIFGLCLGSQLLAEALGGKVYNFKKWEIGFLQVELLETSETLQVFHWHQYSFELPPGAKLIATNSFCPAQAFKYGENIVATQFHPEATKDWVLECADLLDERPNIYSGQVQSSSDMRSQLHLQKSQQDWFFKTLDRWLTS